MLFNDVNPLKIHHRGILVHSGELWSNSLYFDLLISTDQQLWQIDAYIVTAVVVLYGVFGYTEFDDYITLEYAG